MIAQSRLESIAREANRYREDIEAQICRRLAVSLAALRHAEINDRFEPWLAEAHRTLLAKGWATQRDDVVEVRREDASPQSIVDDWNRAQAVWLTDPCVSASVRLVDHCLTALPDILTGRRAAPEVLFPGASLERVEGIYKNNPVADFFNDVLSETLLRVLHARLRHDPRARLRILEVGAGTGGTTAPLLKRLDSHARHIEEYVYTDVSRAFLAHAQTHYAGGRPFLRTALFNVEEAPAQQGLQAASFDVVIASNVLHATRNIARTLRSIKYTLRANGVLLLNELTRKSLVTHVTFGLLEGWWLVEDAELRNPGSPSLTLERWREVLQAEGFRSVLAPVAAVEEALGQQIIAAESDGVVRANGVVGKLPTTNPAAVDARHVNEPAPAVAALDYVLHVLSGALKLDCALIDPAAPLGHYGVDSILIGQLTHRLQQDFEQVTTTLFFERQTANELALHLARVWPRELERACGALASAGEARLGRVAETAAESLADSAPPVTPTEANPRITADERSRAPVLASDNSRAATGLHDIAIIGLSGRYPQAASIEEFWNHLKAGRDCITEIPPDRWPLEGFYEPDPDAAVAAGRSYSKWGGFLDNVRGFDPLFFNISPREALGIDPQERLFLASCWELLEDAGYTRALLAEQYQSRVGVFVGITKTGFELFGPPLWARGERLYPRTSFSSAANRVSYFFDLRGPSLAIDTMCSSSLVAIHEACMHLRQGACQLAIAGGVNIYLHPSGYVGLSAARMLSRDGRCRAFGTAANGFVPGEGVGAVLLKPLEQARADGDRIYAVIKGSSVNHGGRTNGFTVPNPRAHAGLIRDALRQAGVQARDIGYLESHGTGTELGDPIEIAGLSAAFREDTADTQYCRIGSVKSNIGHLEAAAGIAGLTKIILQLQQGVFVSTLHADELNPNIRFAETPFRVQRRLEPWTAERKIAGISSFGAGGANAHLIVEGYADAAPVSQHRRASPGPFVFVLSARTTPQLEQLVVNLREHMQRSAAEQSGEREATYLADVAYTLQVGREALDERLGLVAGSVTELCRALTAYLEGEHGSARLCSGRIRRHTERKGAFASNEALEEAISQWIAEKDYPRLIETWVRGVPIDWRRLYPPQSRPRRIALPHYPFATEECWFPPAGGVSADSTQSRDESSRERSACDALAARSLILHGHESFLTDHRLQGKKILPAVMFLELARAAVKQAAGAGSETVVELQNVVWSTPVEVDDAPKSIHVAVSPAGPDAFHFEVRGGADTGLPIIHARGVGSVAPRTRPQLDLTTLRAQMTRGVIPGPQCYEAFAALGIHYGPSHRGILRIETGRNELLAELEVTATTEAGCGPFFLHPGLLDSALQSCIGLDARIVHDGVDFSTLRAAMPFALREIAIHAPCAGRMWAWVRLSTDQGANVRKMDVDVCDDSGRIAVQLRGYSMRTIDPTADGATVPPSDLATEESVVSDAALLFAQWVPKTGSPTQSAPPAFADIRVVLCGNDASFSPELLGPLVPGATVLHFPLRQEPLDEQFIESSLRLLGVVQNIHAVPDRPALVQLVIPDDTDHQPLMGLSALLWTAAQENRGVLGQVLLAPRAALAAELARLLEAARATPTTRWLRHEQGELRTLRWQEVPRNSAPVPAWRHDGVYLITGGRGPVAQAVVDEILRASPSARVALCGRAPAERVNIDSGRVTYYQADVSQVAAVQALIQAVLAAHGTLTGVIHAAGIHLDRVLERKTPDEWQRVLAPKVSGAVHLDRATAHLPLDFFALWSSGAAVFGHAGQSDYATANAFMDYFAQWRNAQALAGRRGGYTVSLNWPQWAAGGMALTPAARGRLANQFALRPLSTSGALAAFHRGTHTMQSRLLVTTGRVDRILGALNDDGAALAMTAETAKISTAQSAVERRESREVDARQMRAVLRKSIASILRIRPEDIATDVEFGELGFDSVSLTELAQLLSRQLEMPLDPTVFFDHPVIEDCAHYLASQSHSSVAAPVPVMTQPVATLPPEFQPETKQAAAAALERASPNERSAEPIAIVGISAEFPQSPDIEAFWTRLAEGEHCIREIPPERWSWQALFGDPQAEAYRTAVKWGGFIDGAACFDPLFFGISPREAELIDPQQRLLLTHAWWAIEEAGYDPESLSGTNTGVFVGTGNSGYGALASKAGYPVTAYSATSFIPSVGPNRLSFFLNLHGPSVPVETACSSALVAIHEAVRAIRSGQCDAALAGGVMTLVTPDGHISFNKAGMLSLDGRCKAFSANADGYVRGEGVGMLMLKPLSAALAEGAHIHGVIRGTAVNHGGRASSLTAPNPKAQAALLEMAYADANIDPRTVSYIETHGTGTQLGDPIEINALKAAFRSLYERAGDTRLPEPPQVGLGSVKSNIGHLEMAAGVAGVIKVLLQFRHRTLVSTLHCEARNPYIDFTGSPFYLVTENSPWPALIDEQGRTLPRRAGVSSFGFGGVNAHVVLEEHGSDAAERGESQEAGPVLVPLSARTAEQLREVAQNLLAVLDADENLLLENIAFTLQVGRAALEQRLAIIADGLTDLRNKLRAYLQGADEGAGVFIGKPSTDPEALAPFHEDEELRSALEGWFRRRKLSRLAALWVRGARLDWRRLHADRQPRRISLPGYPFAKDRYWIRDAARVNNQAPAAATAAQAAHRAAFSFANTSDLAGLKFTAVFSGSEPFLRDHQVRGQPVLPGVVHLEMMRAATVGVLGALAEGSCVRLRNVIWSRQLVVPSESRVHVRLTPASGALRCDVVGDSQRDSVVYAQCVADSVPAGVVAIAPLGRLQAHLGPPNLDAEMCYRRFEAMGLGYGPTHRAIQSLRRGSNEVLAELRMPDSAAADQDRWVLSPSMLDAALQAAIGLSEADAVTWVPYSVDEIAIYAPCTAARMWAWVRQGAAPQVLDIDLCDEAGRVCVAIRRLTCKALASGEVTAKRTAPAPRAWHEVLTPQARSADRTQFTCRVTVQDFFVVDHMNVVPGVALLEMVRSAVIQGAVDGPVEFTNVVWPQPAMVGPHALELALHLTPASSHVDFEIRTAAPQATRHAQGRVQVGQHVQRTPEGFLDLAALRTNCSRTLDAVAIRRLLLDAPHGPSMLALDRLEIGVDQALGTLRLPAGAGPLAQGAALHPSLMHGVFLTATLFSLASRRDGVVELPFSLESLRLLAPLPETAYVHVSRETAGGRGLSIRVADSNGRVCLVIQGFTTVALKRAAPASHDPLLGELAEVVAELVNLPVAQLDSTTEFSRYGLDSIGLTELSNALNRRYGLSLMPTVLFEHSTLAALARYLSTLQVGGAPRPTEPAPPAHSLPAEPAPRHPVAAREPLAVVGMSARLPGSRDLREFWAHLEANADLISPIPDSRWIRPVGAQGVGAAGFVAAADCFDSLFFGISPREAEIMDPQLRLFLETVWACMEDAGYSSADLAGSDTGVFVGVSTSDYRDLCLMQGLTPDSADLAGGATFHFEIANRVSYTLDLHGPSEAIDTACSSSLIALHRAAESIHAGVCSAAFVGGVNLIANPRLMRDMSIAGMLSADGRCKTFDRRADGYGRGEGVGAILIKRLSAAQADGDQIYGLIRGSAENHGGRANSPTAPNPVAQKQLLVSAYRQAGIAPDTVTYVETHGTGTQLGDPIEINGLKDAFAELYAAFGADFAAGAHCALGSVKTNIGHLEAAAGISAMIKVLLMLRHRRIPGNGHLVETNPYVQLDGSPFYLARRTTDWTGVPGVHGPVRRAGISSFGVGGSNAHVILEEWPDDATESVADNADAGLQLIPLSAKTAERLRACAETLADALRKAPPAGLPSLASVARTLQTGRDAMAHRVAFVSADVSELIGQLARFASDDAQIKGCWRGHVTKTRAVPGAAQVSEQPSSAMLSLEHLAQHWVAGGSVDWRRLYVGGLPKRVSLPSYPFARVRHWLPVLPCEESGPPAPPNTQARDAQVPASTPLQASAREAQFARRGQPAPPNTEAQHAQVPVSVPLQPSAREAQFAVRMQPASGERNASELSESVSFLSGEHRASPSAELVLAVPQWRPLAHQSSAPEVEEGSGRVVVLCGLDHIAPAQIERAIAGSVCLNIARDDAASDELSAGNEQRAVSGSFTSAALRLFEFARETLRKELSGPRRVLLQVVAAERDTGPSWSALAALLKSAHQENPALLGQVLLVNPGDGTDAVLRKLAGGFILRSEPVLHYATHVPQARRWSEQFLPTERMLAPWKNGGIYLITGGLGGLGQLLAREILATTHAAQVILAGRSALDDERTRELFRLQAKGFVSYERVDVRDLQQVQALIQRIIQRHGALHGVIHCAGLHHDGFIRGKSTEIFREVLAPKVAGTVCLDHATRGLDLDCFVLFSSGTGAAGNAGQSDYAAANAFMDEYAHYRHRMVMRGRRKGKTLSLNWSLWAEGGMRLDAFNLARLHEHLGIQPLETSAALRALYWSLSTAQAQVMVVAGDRPKILERVLGIPAPRMDRAAAPAAQETGDLVERVRARLRDEVADLLKIPASALAQDDALEEFGLDSMMVTRLTHRLRDELGEVPRTLFYEHGTLTELAAHLVSFNAEVCGRWVAGDGSASLTTTARFSDTKQVDAALVDNARVDKNSGAESHALNEAGTRQPHAFLSGNTDSFPDRTPPLLPDGESAADRARPIAIVGMTGRFATAANLEALWERLRGGESCITEIPADRWPLEGFYCPEPEEAVGQGKSYGKWGGFLEDFAAFDPLFFNLSARDALAISPQERLFLEVCWQAMEDAALCPSRFSAAERERVGVYGAVTKTQANTSFAALTNRVSFVMDLQGPSVPVDTKCSSALVALHEACGALRRGEIDVAIVGAVNLYLEPRTYIELAQTRLLADAPQAVLYSPSGRGFVPSEGAGAIVLKRLSDAQSNGDGVLALVRGTAVNHNGRTLSFGVPDPQRQRAVIEQAWRAANIEPRSISYIESAANGSEIGDAIEIAALTQAFAGSLSKGNTPPRIGSLKAALGHAEAASGLAQLAKVVLQMKARVICPTVLPSTDTQGRAFVPETGPFELARAACEWTGESPLRAGIHSVGAGGVNAHAVIEEYVADSQAFSTADSGDGPALFVLSAKTETALDAYLQSWERYLANHAELDLRRLAFTVQRGREALRYRFACVARSLEELRSILDAAVRGCTDERYRRAAKGTKVDFTGGADEALMRVAARWIAGEDISWEALYLNGAPRVLNGLPTYPFARKRYWQPPEPQSAEESARAHKPRTPAEQSLSEPLDGARVGEVAAADHSLSEAPNIARAEGAAREVQLTQGASGEVRADPSAAVSESGDAPSPDVLAIQQSVRGVINSLLQFEADDEIHVNDNFAEMGFDSMSIVRFVELLNSTFDLSLEVTAPFNYPSIRELSAHIASRAPSPERPPPRDLESILANLALGELDVDDALSLLDQQA